MLVLSRKRGQSVVISDDIVVTVVDYSRGRVQLGITAPGSTPIFREEIHQRILTELETTAENAEDTPDSALSAAV